MKPFAVSFLASSLVCGVSAFALDFQATAANVNGPAAQASRTSNANANRLSIMKPNARQVEIVGEVIDTWCYASKATGPGRGPDHKKCAETCILGGVTAGIVDDKGNIYVAAKTKAYQGANRTLYPFVAKRVLVKGWLSEEGGCRFLKISDVQEWKPGMKVPPMIVAPPKLSETKLGKPLR